MTRKFKDCIDNNDASKLFKLTKNQLGIKTGGPPETLHMDGKKISKPKEIVEVQINYFTDKIKKLKSNIQNTNTDPLKLLRKSMEKWTDSENRQQFDIREITTLETLEYIKSLGNSTTMGDDLIDPMTIKLNATTLCRPIQHTINRSIATNKFCTKWKLGKTIPLHKGGKLSKFKPESYRPIAILPIISKIAEKAIQSQMMEYLEQTNQLNKNTHAYKQLHSTTSALMQITDYLAETADQNKIGNLMIVDQSAAFDCIDKIILDQKMKLYQFSENTRSWFRDYLSHRSHYVMIGSQKSNIKSIEWGVPQGSVLGPVLYLLYTNEMSECVKNQEQCRNKSHDQNEKLFGENCETCGIMTNFADDTTITVRNKSRIENQVKIEKGLNKITDYLSSNQMVINQDKTQITETMVYQKRIRAVGVPPSLQTLDKNGNPIIVNDSSECRILGLQIQNDLSWRAHLEGNEKPLLAGLRQKLGQLKHLGKSIPTKGRLLLINSLLISRIIYTIPIYGGLQEIHARKIQTIMNNAARFISGAGRRTQTRKLMTKCNWLSFRELVKYHSLVQLWKLVKLRKPEILASKFQLSDDNFIRNQNPRLQIVGRNFRWRSIQDWNQLSQEVRDSTKLSIFKSGLKKWILDARMPTCTEDME